MHVGFSTQANRWLGPGLVGRRLGRRSLGGAVGLATLACSSATTSTAFAGDTGETVLVATGVAVALADVVFSVRDIIAVARDEHPGVGWGVAETIVNVPSTVALNAVTAALAAGHDEDEAIFAIAIAAPAAWTGTLAAHGLWASIDSEAHPGALFAVSPILGVNMSCTMLAFGSTVTGRLSPTPAAVLEVIGGIPGSVLGAVELGRGETKQGLWIGLTAWSGAILVHGLVSAIVDGADDDGDDEDEPPPVPSWEPEPPPLQVPEQPAPPAPPPPQRRAPDMVQAARIQLMPTVMVDIRGREIPAAAAVGVF